MPSRSRLAPSVSRESQRGALVQSLHAAFALGRRDQKGTRGCLGLSGRGQGSSGGDDFRMTVERTINRRR